MPANNRFDCNCLLCGRSYAGTLKSILCPECRSAKKWVCPEKRKAFQPVLDERNRQHELSKAAKAEARQMRLQKAETRKSLERKARKAEREILHQEREASRLELQNKKEAAREKAVELMAEAEAEERRERDLKKRRERAKSQFDWLDRRSRKPKGRTSMSANIAATELGNLWRNLCHADGQVNCLTRATTIAPEVREALATAHLRLRLAGHTAAAAAKVCPVTLLEDTGCELAAALNALPTSDDLPETEAQERDRLKTLLGL